MKNYEYRTENSIKLLYHAEILHSSFSVLKLKKKQSVCKPGSVLCFQEEIFIIHSSFFIQQSVCHLSEPHVTIQALAVYPPTWSEQLS